ncbi:hypothetical protein SDC9_200626 [bioreactor metagenome]|uniref:Uncharacterized protein n=1 Tax=bioreactor metagenome TaxID=1076179 RepID=A0A645J0J3_9ZZZZ
MGFDELVFQVGHIHAALVHANADGFRAVGAEGLQSAEEGGGFGQDDVSVVQEDLRNQINSLGGAGQDHDVRLFGGDALPCHHFRDGFTKRAPAGRCPVLKHGPAGRFH